MLLEDMLVIDAVTIYPRFTRGGSLYSLDVIDGSTITPLVGEDGRSPEPPDPAFQQVLHGVPAADFSSDELLYLPRNVRLDDLTAFDSQSEWIPAFAWCYRAPRCFEWVTLPAAGDRLSARRGAAG
jgi:hypothetical protein